MKDLKEIGSGPWDSKTFKELEASISIEDVVKSLRAQEVNRLAHKRYHLKRAALLEKALELQAAGKITLDF